MYMDYHNIPYSHHVTILNTMSIIYQVEYHLSIAISITYNAFG